MFVGRFIFWGVGIEETETISSILERLGNPKLSVYNYSVFGYNTVQELLVARSYLDELKPDHTSQGIDLSRASPIDADVGRGHPPDKRSLTARITTAMTKVERPHIRRCRRTDWSRANALGPLEIEIHRSCRADVAVNALFVFWTSSLASATPSRNATLPRSSNPGTAPQIVETLMSFAVIAVCPLDPEARLGRR
jgi:hypothetical protein